MITSTACFPRVLFFLPHKTMVIIGSACTCWFDMECKVRRFDIFLYRFFDMMSYDDSIFNISASIMLILLFQCLGDISEEIIM